MTTNDLLDRLLPLVRIPKRAPNGLVWGFRTEGSRVGYKYPYAGRWAYPQAGSVLAPGGRCGPGLHVAKTAAGAAMGGHSLGRVLIVGYLPADVLGQDSAKVRVRRLYVAGRANLREANLYGANLREANLSGADMSGADLRRVSLRGANLLGANLYGTDLYEADLRGANLSEANLSEANLRGADLRWANLRVAVLYGTDLRVAVRDG